MVETVFEKISYYINPILPSTTDRYALEYVSPRLFPATQVYQPSSSYVTLLKVSTSGFAAFTWVKKKGVKYMLEFWNSQAITTFHTKADHNFA